MCCVPATRIHTYIHFFYHKIHTRTGSEMRLLICGFWREQEDFKDLDTLIAAINKDVEVNVSYSLIVESHCSHVLSTDWLHPFFITLLLRTWHPCRGRPLSRSLHERKRVSLLTTSPFHNPVSSNLLSAWLPYNNSITLTTGWI